MFLMGELAAYWVSHDMEADTMSRPESCRIAGEPADYQRYGIAKGEIAAWEDGFRTRPGGPTNRDRYRATARPARQT